VGCYHNFYQYTRVAPTEISWRIISVYVDRGFTEQEKIEVVNAIMQWNYVLNNYIQLRIESFDATFDEDSVAGIQEKRGYMFRKISESEACALKECSDETLAFVNGIGSRGDTVYVIGGREREEKLRGVVMHEIGHLMGVRHIEGTLMDENYDPITFQCVDRITERWAAYRQGLDPNKLNYCIIGDDPN
jgi:predicted Zn-dependent protease